MGRACSTNAEKRILVGKSDGKRPLGRPRRRSVHNIVTWMARAFLGNDL
jgi:hypothetical protein